MLDNNNNLGHNRKKKLFYFAGNEVFPKFAAK
jgi:hypothetical protein